MIQVTLAPVNIIHIAYITLAVLGLLLLSGRGQYKALMLFLGAHLIQESFNILEEQHITSQYYLITPAIQLAFGPLYYLFAKNLIYGDLNIRQHLIHLLPAVIAIGFTHWWPTELMIAFAILVTYFFFTFRLLHRYHKVLENTIADGDKHSLNWLTRTLIVVFVIEFIDFTRLNLQLTLSYELLVNWYFVSALISFLCTAYLVLKAVRQPLLYSGISDIQKRIEERQEAGRGEDRGDVELARTLFSAVEAHQLQTLAYRRPKYSLRNLADEMGLTEQSISWAINTGGQKNFSDFINDLRIDEIKQSLAQSANDKNILDIALNAGFNSKSSFNAVFKKHTGMTPSQYAKQ